MYYPFLRGKQYELITLRETAEILASRGFVPIVEPVKESLASLRKTLDTLVRHQVEVIVIANPCHGDFVDDASEIDRLIREDYSDKETVIAGIAVREDDTVRSVLDRLQHYEGQSLSIVHSGFPNGGELAKAMGTRAGATRHIFDDSCSKLYRRHFPNGTRVLLHDGFEKQTNRKYPDLEFFSDLHLTYPEDGMNGFGDFLIVGDDYAETGGPAYTVAIHITFIDGDNDEEMRIYHFKSDRSETPTDPAGKFAEALDKLISKVDESDSKILETDAIREFRQLHAREHFPGLGYVKKLSMKHHIETLSWFFSPQR